MKKTIVFILLIFTFCNVSFVCSKLHSTQDQRLDRVTINALLEEHPTVRVMAKLLPEFERETGILVNIEVIPFEAMTLKAGKTLSSRSSRYDVYMDGWVNALEWAFQGHLEPLDGYIENSPMENPYLDMDDFIEAYLLDSAYEGTQYGFPVYGESTFLYFRKDIFSQYGIDQPETMEEIALAAQKIDEKCQDIYPITFRGREGVHIVYAWSSFLWAFGGRWLDEKGELDLDSPEAVQAARFFTDLLRKYGPPGSKSFGWEENRDLFLKGKAAMSIDATVNGAFNENPKFSKVVGKVGYIPTPKYSKAHIQGGQASLVTHQLYINRYSQNKDAAFQFISWATSQNLQMRSIEIEPNCGMTSRSVINSTRFSKAFGAFKESLLASLKNGNSKYLPIIPEAGIIFQKVGKALTEVLIGTKEGEDALKKVNQEINEIIRKNSTD